MISTEEIGSPLEYDCWNIFPSLLTVTSRCDDKALTHDTPTPWSPPETL